MNVVLCQLVNGVQVILFVVLLEDNWQILLSGKMNV